MFGLARFWHRNKWYHCDGCNRRVLRAEGRALARRSIVYAEAVGKVSPPVRVLAVSLYCPTCAVGVKAREQKEVSA